MTLNVGNLQAKLDMDTKGFKRGIGEAETGIKGMSTSFAGLKTAALAGAAAIGAAFVAIGAAAVSSANSIDEAMATIRVGTGATGETLEGLGDSMRTVLGQVPVDAATVGTAIADLNTRLGLTGDALEDMTLRFTELSRITGTDVGTNIKTVTRLFGDFSVATEDQADAMDYLFKVSQQTGAGVDTLATKATQYGTSLRAMGFDMGTSIALLGKFEKEGVNTETVLASLKIGMANMAREGVTDANEALTLLMDEVKNAPSDVEATAKSMEIFGSRAAADMAMAIREGRFEVNDLIDSVESSNETILQAADDSKTLGDRFGILKNQVSLALEPLGEGIIEALEGVMDWWDSNGEGIFNTVMGAFDGLRGAAQPFIDMYTEFWGTQAQKMTDFWNEDGAIVMAALENIRAAFQLAIEYIAKTWEWLWPYLEGIIGPAIDVLLDIVGVFAALFAGDWDALKTKLVDLTVDLVDLLYGVFNLGFDLIMEAFAAFGNAVLSVLNTAWNMVLGGLEGMINKAVDMLNGLISSMNAIPGVNIPLIGRVSFERGEAGTVTAPKLSDFMGDMTPGEAFKQTFGIAEEEELIPELVEAAEEETTTPTIGNTVSSALGASLAGAGDVGVDSLVNTVSSKTLELSQEIVIPVQIDGYEVGRAVYTNWNRRTGGGLNI